MKYKISDDERDEFRPRRKKLLRCRDRMCGADDCPNCHPEIMQTWPYGWRTPSDDAEPANFYSTTGGSFIQNRLLTN